MINEPEPVFENIAERIILELQKAKESVFIAVAWITNREILNVLKQKTNNGCQINIMYSGDHINEYSSDDFDLLKENNSNVFAIGDGDHDLMHHKFCVIDYCTVITGSYNWSRKAESNHENVVIASGFTSLASKYIDQFNKIKKSYFPNYEPQKKSFPLDKIVRRLEILKNYVLLEEIDELQGIAAKLKEYEFNSQINEIVTLLENEEFGDAIKKIETFISKNQQLSIWTDPEIAALKLQIKNIENQICAFDSEKIELNNIINDFQRQHSIALGKIIIEILNLRKLKYKNNKEKFEEAEEDEKEYQGQYDAEIKKEVFELSEEEKKELKSKFRKAHFLCHPNMFGNEPKEVQDQAEKITIELIKAKDKKDLAKVSEILENLKKGILSVEKGDQISDKEILRATIERMKLKLRQLENELHEIKESDTFKKIYSIEDWATYFEEIKEQLLEQLEQLKKEVIEDEQQIS